jgi:hypothetical protein
MKVFVGGIVAALLGILGIIVWHHAVFKIILGAIITVRL